MQQPQEQQTARHVRVLYNYQVGQKAAVGRLLLVIFAASAFVFWGALAFDMVSALARGFGRALFGH